MNRGDDDGADGGVPHDAWLREALRHAPDADAAPPPALSETILREAHAAAREAAPVGVPPASTSLVQRVLAAWSWLARPPVAAAFASVLVAATIGVMWWDRPLDEMPPPREAPAVATAPPTPQQQSTPAAPPAPTAPNAPAVTARPAPEPPPAAPARTEPAARPGKAHESDAAKSRIATAPETTRAAEDSAAAGAAAPKAAPELRDEAARARERDASAREDRRAAASADAALAAPSSSQPPSAAPAETSPSILAEAAPAQKAERRSAPAAAAPLAQGFARREASPLGALRSTVAAQPQRWAWQRDGGTVGAMNTALAQWLQRVDETTRGRWAVPPTATDTAALPAIAIQLLHDGSPHTTLRLGAATVEVELPGGGARWRAELSAGEATALRIELDEATR